MLTPPAGLSDADLVLLIAREWGVAASSIGYRALGFGSHHWELLESSGTRWFVTVDELDRGGHSAEQSPVAALDRLSAALGTAAALRDEGAEYVVAPVATGDGEPLALLGSRFAVALYPYVDGEQYNWGDFSSPAHRSAVLDLVVALHTAPVTTRRHAMSDDFVVPHRDAVEAALLEGVPYAGPYSRPAAQAVADSAMPIRELWRRYDDLLAGVRKQPDRHVLTHGEPHSANTMRTTDGWVLIDWETVRIAPPERDLWLLDSGDGSVFDAYAAATGTAPVKSALELYRLRWDLADLANYVARFRAPHTGTADDDESWRHLQLLVDRLPT